VVTTELLGKAIVSDQAYENPDKSPITIDQDYLGKQRNKSNPTPGPFEIAGKGLQKIQVWE
jgi:alpha-N-arabinofuranosidase